MADWPIDQLQHQLPHNSQLPSRGQTSHPLIFLFGEQNNGAWLLGERRLSLPVNYAEMLVVAPEIDYAGGPVNAVIEGFCNYPPAIFVGTGFYGYTKQQAEVGWARTQFGVKNRSTNLTARVTSSRGSTNKCINTLSALLSKSFLGVRTDGAVVTSNWNIEFKHARRQTAKVEFECPTRFLGRTHWQASGVLVDQSPWTLSLPAYEHSRPIQEPT